MQFWDSYWLRIDLFIYLLLFNYDITYVSVVKKLIYVMVYTCFDISHEVYVVICFMDNFCKGHLKVVKYNLISILNFNLIFSTSSTLSMVLLDQ